MSDDVEIEFMFSIFDGATWNVYYRGAWIGQLHTNAADQTCHFDGNEELGSALGLTARRSWRRWVSYIHGHEVPQGTYGPRPPL